MIIAAVLTIFTFTSGTRAEGQSLADCKVVASQFRNTCNHGDYDTSAADVASMDAQNVTCEDTSNRASTRCTNLGGVLTGTTCAWQRKLCLTCRTDNGVTKIRIQTNNLPDHCITSSSVKPQNFDYEVVFNQKNTYGTWAQSFTDQGSLDSAVCPIQKTFDTASLQMVEFGAVESSRAMGFALNGVAFQFANNMQDDPVYPKAVYNEQPLDLCLGHNQLNSASGMYHYHDISPCINQTFLQGKTMSQCISTAECEPDIVAWALSGYEGWKRKTVIGLAKDGHVIYGPYNDQGRLWSTVVVDACNGAWSADKTDYFYVGTQWHPYAVGCQGPSNFPHNDHSLYANCSRNSMSLYAASAVSSPQPGGSSGIATTTQSEPTSSHARDSFASSGNIILGAFLFGSAHLKH